MENRIERQVITKGNKKISTVVLSIALINMGGTYLEYQFFLKYL